MDFQGIAPVSEGEFEEGTLVHGCGSEGSRAPSAHRRPSYPLTGCVPAEPASVSLGGETIPKGAGADKANARGPAEGRKSVAKKWAFLV
jgi:hypothetical protein